MTLAKDDQLWAYGDFLVVEVDSAGRAIDIDENGVPDVQEGLIRYVTPPLLRKQ